ncbi:hypothetical protein [Vogesella indigofera]|uniref:Secreted Zn-dependent protease n=1 Tax=Vogesella indigofera TaxID=45465 RepID=A0ABT5I8Q2_VOGIN|nr:hypothetical protein [Vogesella indigofera]MDC7692567.1 hypothetical protein [Vogesella indigofera]
MRLAFLIPLLFPVVANAGANLCTGLLRQPTVTLELGKPLRQYRQDQTMDELTAVAKSTGVPVSGNGVVTGLTTDRRRIGVRAWYETMQLQSGFCLAPHVKITIDQRVVTVAMPKEIPSNSCFFQVTLEHEHKHAKIAEDGMDAVLRQEAASLQSFLAGQAGFQQTLGDSQQKIDQLKAYAEMRVQRALDRVDQMNADIDTPAEYAKVNGACKGRQEPEKLPWWKRIFNSSAG